jgi:hypothetical protein
MPTYVPIEYPKWVDGVLVNNAAEEQAHRAALVESAAVARATELARMPSPAAERMRLARQRQRDGIRVIPFEVRDEEIEGLVARGLLDPVARHNRNAIANALGRLFDAVPPQRWPVSAAR